MQLDRPTTFLQSGVYYLAAKREVLGLLIDRIVPARIGYGKYDVQITWTPLGESVRKLAEAVAAAA